MDRLICLPCKASSILLVFAVSPGICPLLLVAGEDPAHLLLVPDEVVPKPGPGLEGHSDGVPVRLPHLADLQEDAVPVGAHVEVEPLVVHPEGHGLGQLRGLVVVPSGPAPLVGVLVPVVLDQLRQGVSKLYEPLCGQHDGLLNALAVVAHGAVSPADSLPDPEEAAALVLL